MDPSSKRLFVTIWLLHGIALVVVLSRIGFQVKFARIFWIEDGLSTLALLFLLGDGMLITIMTIYASSVGEDVHLSPILPLMDSAALEKTATATGNLMRLRFSEVLLFWTCLLLLKASFLAMWYRVSSPTTRLKTAMWRIVTFVTVLAFISLTITFSVACKSLNPSEYDALVASPILTHGSQMRQRAQQMAFVLLAPVQHCSGYRHDSNFRLACRSAGMAPEEDRRPDVSGNLRHRRCRVLGHSACRDENSSHHALQDQQKGVFLDLRLGYSRSVDGVDRLQRRRIRVALRRLGWKVQVAAVRPGTQAGSAARVER
jgi:hypothetical protein